MVEGSATSGNMISTNKAIETNMWQAIPFWMQWWLWWLSLVGFAIVLFSRKFF